eukprot:g8526.t1
MLNCKKFLGKGHALPFSESENASAQAMRNATSRGFQYTQELTWEGKKIVKGEPFTYAGDIKSLTEALCKENSNSNGNGVQFRSTKGREGIYGRIICEHRGQPRIKKNQSPRTSPRKKKTRSKRLGCKVINHHRNHPRYTGTTTIGKLSKEDKDYIIEQAQRYSWPIHVLRKFAEEKAGAMPRKELHDEILDAVTIKTTDSVSAKLMVVLKQLTLIKMFISLLNWALLSKISTGFKNSLKKIK